jgi:hypothetical protein
MAKEKFMANFVGSITPFFTFSFAFGFCVYLRKKPWLQPIISTKGSSQWGLECIESHYLAIRSSTTIH